jgi:hypothetical protein
MTEVADLLSGVSVRLGTAQLAERWDTLPEVVRRYLRTALPNSPVTEPVASVHLVHGGAFRTSPSGRWLPIAAEEWHTVAEPGFVWKARFSPLPLVRLDVVDSLIRGKGAGVVKAAGKLPVSTMSGPETDQSASARWLMEAVWFPAAYVGPSVHWEGIDADSARVSLTNRPDVAVVMRFDRTSAMPVFLECERYMSRTRRSFRGKCSIFERHGGVLIPTVISGTWLLPEGEFAFADFELGSIEFNPDPA